MARSYLCLFAVVLVLALPALVMARVPDMTAFAKAANSGTLMAGVAKVNATMPIGTPLAGYNHGQRRVPLWPLPDVKNYTTWMVGAEGHIDGTWVRALVLDDGSGTRVAVVTLDGIGADGSLCDLAWTLAEAQGLGVARSNVIFAGSHSHSGPGAISPEFLWAVAPATDLLVPELQTLFASRMAQALLAAEAALQPAEMAIGSFELLGVTQNRRAKISHYVTAGTIDPHLGVLRVDALGGGNGSPLAVLWNFAIHGVCYGPENLLFSGDIMGRANTVIETDLLPGAIALFMNGDAGDIDPTSAACANAPNFTGSLQMATAVAAGAKNLSAALQSAWTIQVASELVPFGNANLNYTLQRFNNCTQGGPLDICSLCTAIRCDLNVHLPSGWLENTPRFTAFALQPAAAGAADGTTVIVTMPGEALVELGWMVRNATLDLGFATTFLSGYSNNHMGYFATSNEYVIGGYESDMTFWGIDTADMVLAGTRLVAQQVAPL